MTILDAAAWRVHDGQGERNERCDEVARCGLEKLGSQQRAMRRHCRRRLPTENPDQERGKSRWWEQPGQDRPASIYLKPPRGAGGVKWEKHT